MEHVLQSYFLNSNQKLLITLFDMFNCIIKNYPISISSKTQFESTKGLIKVKSKLFKKHTIFGNSNH